LHLEFADQVVGKETGKQIGLIAVQFPYRDVVLMTVGFEFSEDTLLGAPAFMEGCYPLGTQGLIGDNDFELIVVFIGNEQI